MFLFNEQKINKNNNNTLQPARAVLQPKHQQQTKRPKHRVSTKINSTSYSSPRRRQLFLLTTAIS